MLGEIPADHLEIEPENWPAVIVFVSCETQWRFAPSGRRIAMDYPSVDASMRMQKTPNRPDVFQRIRVMERAVLDLQK